MYIRLTASSGKRSDPQPNPSGRTLNVWDPSRITKDGRLIDISTALTVSPVRDGAGAIIGVSKVARDITEHKKAKSSG